MMTPEEQNLIDRLVESVRVLGEVVTAQGNQLQLLNKAFQQTSSLAGNAFARSHILSLITAATVAEMADGDRERLDQLLTRATAAGESHKFGDGVAGPVVLSIIDDFRSQAESYFLDREA